PSVVYLGTQVDCPVSRVIVVGELSLHRDDIYIVNAVVVQHLFRHVPPRHAAAQRHFGILLELTPETPLHNHADEHNANKNNPISCNHNIILFLFFLSNNLYSRQIKKYTEPLKWSNTCQRI